MPDLKLDEEGLARAKEEAMDELARWGHWERDGEADFHQCQQVVNVALPHAIRAYLTTSGGGQELSELERKAVLVAMVFGTPDPMPPEIESARRKLKQ